ncbi:MAG: hypothetical protein HOW73_04850 [Polyangiaceae bacterium]|nr:hypothetical protein [Polyangiaceae bacterium]
MKEAEWDPPPEPELPPGAEFSSPTGRLIAAWEHGGGDIKAVRKQYDPLPHWPGGKSGLTIGMGYDLRYQSGTKLRKDFGNVLTPAEIAKLDAYTPQINAKGKQVPPQKKASKAAVTATADVEVRYKDAVKVFEDTVLPRYQEEAYNTFPGLKDMDPYTQAAVVSMVYNRGSSIPKKTKKKKQPLRRTHFLEIKEAVVKKDILAIAATLRKMKAEHTKKSTKAGLRRRRESEAKMIEDNYTAAQYWYYGQRNVTPEPAGTVMGPR